MKVPVLAREERARAGAGAAFVLAGPDVWSAAMQSALEDTGLSVVACAELHELFEACRFQTANLLVLAKDNPAFAVRACRAMRGLRDVPLMVVIPRDSELIPTLDAGADDCVVARADPAVLVARVRALLRRAQQTGRSGGVIVVRDIVVDLDKCQATLRDEPAPLTPTEFLILAYLAQKAGKVVDARTLLSAAHEHDYDERDAQNLVKVHIANLRRKLGDNRTDNPYILCVRGFGYMLERRSERREDDILTPYLELDAAGQN